MKTPYQPKTGIPCSCRPGIQRDNCPSCEGTGQQIDFKAIRAASSFSRQDYLEGRCTHRQYYAQFVSAGTKQRVLRTIGEEAIRKSTDPNLNDIPLSKWDALFQGGAPWEVSSAMKVRNDYPTMAGLVCIAKEAARQIAEIPHA